MNPLGLSRVGEQHGLVSSITSADDDDFAGSVKADESEEAREFDGAEL